jgi:formylmethanofuran dehydrogenase subunit C
VTARDIEGFSLFVLPNVYQNWDHFNRKAGFFLSGLINHCKEMDITINTQKIETLIRTLGYRNSRNITVMGNVGSDLGYKMIGGSILVEGNATGIVGCQMKNGIITIKRNAGDSVGPYMEGGTIIIEGDARNEVGYGMEGGEIHVLGKIGYIGRLKHGKIYHKGKLIVNK